MFIVKKNISGKEYYYLNKSVREGDRVISKTIAYLGKDKIEAEKKALDIEKQMKQDTEKKKIEQIKDEIMMDDYLVLKGYGLSPSFDEQVLLADKGHGILLRNFFTNIKNNKPSPINFDRLNTVAELTLTIDQLACQGGGTYDFA